MGYKILKPGGIGHGLVHGLLDAQIEAAGLHPCPVGWRILPSGELAPWMDTVEPGRLGVSPWDGRGALRIAVLDDGVGNLHHEPGDLHVPGAVGVLERLVVEAVALDRERAVVGYPDRLVEPEPVLAGGVASRLGAEEAGRYVDSQRIDVGYFLRHLGGPVVPCAHDEAKVLVQLLDYECAIVALLDGLAVIEYLGVHCVLGLLVGVGIGVYPAGERQGDVVFGETVDVDIGLGVGVDGLPGVQLQELMALHLQVAPYRQGRAVAGGDGYRECGGGLRVVFHALIGDPEAVPGLHQAGIGTLELAGYCELVVLPLSGAHVLVVHFGKNTGIVCYQVIEPCLGNDNGQVDEFAAASVTGAAQPSALSADSAQNGVGVGGVEEHGRHRQGTHGAFERDLWHFPPIILWFSTF
jgi:hypothetical protein